MKLKMENKAQIMGYYFGKICRVIGTIVSIVFSIRFILPLMDEANPVSSLKATLWCIPVVVISALVMMYGIWRTGGEGL